MRRLKSIRVCVCVCVFWCLYDNDIRSHIPCVSRGSALWSFIRFLRFWGEACGANTRIKRCLFLELVQGASASSCKIFCYPYLFGECCCQVVMLGRYALVLGL